MTDEVAMSRPGVRSLIQLARQQHEHHRAIWEFTRDQQLYEGHWFDKGFLALFQGDYDSATDDVFAGMSDASSGTSTLVGRIEHSRDQLQAADQGVEITMTKLSEVQEAVQVPEFVKRYGGVLNVGGAEPPSGGKHRGHRNFGSASNTIDAVSSGLSIAHHTDQVVDGVTTDEELDDFVDEHTEKSEEMADE